MLVFYAPTRLDFLVICILSFIGLSVHVVDKNNVTKNFFFLGAKRIHRIDLESLESEDTYGRINIVNYASKTSIKKYLSCLRLEKFYQRISKFYNNIDMVDQKLNLTLISSLRYHEFGFVYAYYLSKCINKSTRLIVINCDVSSFITHEYKIFDQRSVHIVFPIGQLISLLYRFAKLIVLRSIAKKNNNEARAVNSKLLEKPENDVAVLFHRRDSFGHLYKKRHYFSSDETNALHWDNVVKCAIYPDGNTPSYLLPLKVRPHFKDLGSFFRLIDPVLFIRSTVTMKRAQIILFVRFLEYLAWQRCFKNSTVKKVIIDYDFLFPKPLSLALDHLGIKTLALQERPNGSLYYLTYGTICDFYLYAGELWRHHGKKNNSIITRKSLNFGSWRNYFFSDDSLKIRDMQFHKELSNKRTNRKIVFIGHFVGDQAPVTSLRATNHFLEYVDFIAQEFSDCSIFIRMKELSKDLYQSMMVRYLNISNVYISTDYDTNALSYAICRDADVIVSVQNSLADEALAFGKFVVLIDDLYTVNQNVSYVYPPDYSFLIAYSALDARNLIDKIFASDINLLAKYKGLKEALSADQMFKDQSDIPRAIESVFASE
ncbi:hypothetical protein OAS14_00750 [Alphaproteobacteria bacterium]|nr:hypothetical protein [Alphaproteobacteria bacterium]